MLSCRQHRSPATALLETAHQAQLPGHLHAQQTYSNLIGCHSMQAVRLLACMQCSIIHLVFWHTLAHARPVSPLPLPYERHQLQTKPRHFPAIFPPLSCRFSGVRSLFSSAQGGPLDSIIIRGWQLDPHFSSHLSTFLQQLQDCSSLQKLVLTIPCTSTAAAALGKFTSLRSLRMCMDVSRDSEARLRQDSDFNWTAGSWWAAIQPLKGLTSLQLQLPVVLRALDDLGLESLGQLRRLELLLEKPFTPGNGNAEVNIGLHVCFWGGALFLGGIGAGAGEATHTWQWHCRGMQEGDLQGRCCCAVLALLWWWCCLEVGQCCCRGH